MPCPICDNKAANCDCTREEKEQYETIEHLENILSAFEKTNLELMSLLKKCRDKEFNSFEPDNQSKFYHELCDTITKYDK